MPYTSIHLLFEVAEAVQVHFGDFPNDINNGAAMTSGREVVLLLQAAIIRLQVEAATSHTPKVESTWVCGRAWILCTELSGHCTDLS